MEKIVIFGGSFNPPTKAHFELGLKAMDYIHGDKLCFVPVGDKYVKGEIITSTHRVNMLNILCEEKGYRNVTVDLTEVTSSKNLKTIETLKILSEKYKDSKLYFLLGADNLLHISEWYNAEEILKNYKILAIKRDGYDIEDIIKTTKLLTKYKENIITVPIDQEMLISSTKVRELICNDDNGVEDYIEASIKDYILKNNLYKK